MLSKPDNASYRFMKYCLVNREVHTDIATHTELIPGHEGDMLLFKKSYAPILRVRIELAKKLFYGYK